MVKPTAPRILIMILPIKTLYGDWHFIISNSMSTVLHLPAFSMVTWRSITPEGWHISLEKPTNGIEEVVASRKLAHLVKDIRQSSQRNKSQGRNGVKVINMINGLKDHVDNGSSSKIMYEHCFKSFGANVWSRLRKCMTLLVGFSGEICHPLGVIDLQENIDALRTVIKEKDHKTKEKTTLRKLVYADSKREASNEFMTRNFSNRLSLESSGTCDTHGKSHSARKSQKRLPKGKEPSHPRRSR
nr:reverse transcriptase domain-containing protein [Tanacetum cinerariifolium]